MTYSDVGDERKGVSKFGSAEYRAPRRNNLAGARSPQDRQSMKGERQTMNSEHVYHAIFETLKNIPLKEYESEEKELQPYLGQEIANVLDKSFPGKYETKTSIGGRKRPRVDLLGTNFWPDIEVSSLNGEPILAVEVKLAKKRSLAAAISGTIGQCMIYTLKYQHVVGFRKNQVTTYQQNNEYDEQFEKMLHRLKLPLIIRPWKGSRILSFDPIGRKNFI
jgi:hypothetical protein